MDFDMMLSKGSIGHILEGNHIQNPVLQILAYKNVTETSSGNNSTKRYRFLISDGIYSHQCCIMMGDLIGKIEQGEYEKFTIIKLKNYICNNIQQKKIIIMLNPEVIVKGSVCNRIIGKPVSYGSSEAPPLSSIENSHEDMNVEDFNFENVDTKTKSFNATPKKFKNNDGVATKPSFKAQINQNAVCSIATITPYLNKWSIKGRIIHKSSIREWSNAKGEGKLFSFDLKDSSSEIKITAFKNECDRFYDIIELGKVYLVSKGIVKNANKQFSNLENDYEITLTSDSLIEKIDDDSDCPQMSYSFKLISDISKESSNSFVDIAGICKDPGELTTIVQKSTNKELKKRDIILLDQSKCEIRLTLWNDDAVKFNANENNVVVIKGAKISDFNGVSLNYTRNSILLIDPPLKQVYALKGWYDRAKDDLVTQNLSSNTTSVGLSNWAKIESINTENVFDSNVYQLSTKATVVQLGKPSLYKSCPLESCKKKLTDMNNGFFKCDKCNKEYTNFKYSFVLSFVLSDHTKEVWVNVFSDGVEKLLNRSCDDLGRIKENSQEEFDEILNEVLFSSYVFKLRAKNEHFQDESRIRTHVLTINSINNHEYGKKLLSLIKELD